MVKDNKGTAIIEYAIIGALVACLLVLTLQGLGKVVAGTYSTVGTMFVSRGG